MAWSMLIPVATGALGAQAKMRQAEKNNHNQKLQNQVEAEKTRNSAWTGHGPGKINTQYQDEFGAGLQGAASGAQIGGMFSGMLSGGPAPQPQETGLSASASSPSMGGGSWSSLFENKAQNPYDQYSMGSKQFGMA